MNEKINIFNKLRLKNITFQEIKFNSTHFFISVRNCVIIYFEVKLRLKTAENQSARSFEIMLKNMIFIEIKFNYTIEVDICP